MQKPVLSILIPSTHDRADDLTKLLSNLKEQRDRLENQDEVEIMVCIDNKEISIGKKRNNMLAVASGEFCAFIDSDDKPESIYLESILYTFKNFPHADSIGMRGTMTTDGDPKTLQTWAIRNIYDWKDNQDGFRYVRYTNHWSPIRTSHARAVGYKDIRFGEDYDYSMRLKASGLIKFEPFIDADLYHYQYKKPKTKKESNDKYGIK